MKIRMTSIKPFLGMILVCFVCLLPASKAFAQEPETPPVPPSVQMREDFSDDELKSFVKANEKVMAIQLDGEQKMISAIEEEGLTVNRFHEILEQQRDPQKGGETSPDELKSFNNAAQVILEENAKIEEEMTSTLEEEGIDVETYQQIMLAYQQSPAVQERVNKLVKSIE